MKYQKEIDAINNTIIPPKVMFGTMVTMNSSIFRSYDIRGRYPDEINADIAEKIAGACAVFFEGGPIVVAHDIRHGSNHLALATIAGLKRGLEGLRKNITIIQVGYSTTPMFYFLVNHLNASGGIMITASHNPKEWNGMKVVGPKAIPISGTDVQKALEKTTQ